MKILVVVDMQNDFISGSLGTSEAQNIIPNVVKAIETYADKNTVILFTKDTHQDNYMNTLEGKNLPVLHCIDGTNGWDLNAEVMTAFEANREKYSVIGNIYPLVEDHVILKPTFGSMDLQNVIYTLSEVEEIEEITLMGLCTGICVLSNAILCKATLPEVPISVVENCCACVTPESHKTAIEAMKLCQINII